MRKSLQLLMLIVVAGVLLSGCGGGGTSQSPGNNGTGNPLPSVSSLSPTSATAGGAAFTLTVSGTSFVSGSVVKWAGTSLTTTFVSATSLTAAVPASDLSATGTADVIVTNPTPGGGSSAAKTFNINNPAPAVTSLSQTSANVGSGDFTLTVTGSSFVSTSVVNWNGSVRTTTFGSATSLTASITAADITIAGSAHISVSNPTPGGGNSSNLTFTITPQIANGNALPGDPNSPAVDATSDVPPVGVDGSQVLNGVIMSRLDVRFAKSATVGQVNTALANIGGGIVSMSGGFTSVTIGIPQQNSVAGLNALVAQLESSPGILFAGIGWLPNKDRFFPGVPGSTSNLDILHLLPARFPAAWNLLRPDIVGDPANDTTVRPCPFAPVVVVMNDFFAGQAPGGFAVRVPSADEPIPPGSGYTVEDLQHGFDTTEVLNDAGNGANPFPYSGCISLQLVQDAQNLTPYQDIDDFVANLPVGERFIVSVSLGFGGGLCTGPCLPPDGKLLHPADRAQQAAYWKEKTFSHWSSFLLVNSAGNARDNASAGIYPGMGDSRFNSVMSISQLSDPQFNFINDDSLWSAVHPFVAFKSLKATTPEQAAVAQAISDAGIGGQAVADNVIVAGATVNQDRTTGFTQHVTPDQLPQAAFSETNPDVLAVGVDVNGLNGTSFSAPQVAGLASYLWMLSPDLHNFEPISFTKRAIVANTRNKFIDAYASALSLDANLTPQTAPMRLGLLDLNGNGKFDELDLNQFLRHFFVVTGDPNTGDISHQTLSGTTADFSRFDLNGDGFTTAAGTLRERFDLDRVGSTQYGASVYSNITETIENQQIQFDENAVTDLEILCFYAYSPTMYQGDTDARKNLLAGRCGLSITPAKVTLSPGQNQQFTANTPGNDPVIWSTTCGIIDGNGLYTAGNDTGPCTVRATDTNNSSLSGTATVTLTPTCTFPAQTFHSLVGLSFRNHGASQDFELDNQPGSLTRQLPGPNGSASGTAGQGTYSLTASDPDTAKDAGVGGVTAQGFFRDQVIVNPTDLALIGQHATATATVEVVAHPQIGGDNAAVNWDLSIDTPNISNDFSGDSGITSGVANPSHGDPNGKTYTITIPLVLGQSFDITSSSIAVAGFGATPPAGSTPPTGSASMTVDVNWGGITNVQDQGGNSVSFTVCSFTGTNWAARQ